MSYLLVAILPGEVQEAGGEQLIFSPGITVHGVRASRLGWRSLRSFSAANGRPSFIRLPPTSVSFSARLSLSRLLLRPAPWMLSNEQRRCFWLLLPLSRERLLPKNTEWDAFEGGGSQRVARGPLIGVSYRVRGATNKMKNILISQEILSRSIIGCQKDCCLHSVPVVMVLLNKNN